MYKFRRIAIIGCGGAGKSTLARKLGEILKLPVYHLDSLFWKAGWVPMPVEEWKLIQEELTSKDEWIIDGNYRGTMDIRLSKADTIIFLDYPTYICLFRVIKRLIKYYGKTRPDMAEGCNETLDLEFIKWILNFRRNKRPDIINKINTYKDRKNIYIIKSPKELEVFIEQIQKYL
ncbi:MAG: DNA topology modulation protein [Tissierellia bacterium]|nr:DNA topology modulation protein [Tissierellia bacterium]